MSTEERFLRIENALSTLVDLAQRADERMTRLEEAQRLTEQRWERAEARWERVEQRWERTEDGIRSLLTIAEIHEREITTIGEVQARTDERLNALIDTVERYISERQNGKP